jgi:hypothetical protein
MPRTRLHKLAAVYLAALYGAVGVSGESIHYLATDAWGILTHLRQAGTGGYYHVHAPDFHGHYHRHDHAGSHSHGDHSHAAIVVQDKGSESTHGDVHEPSSDPHESHSCPLLSLVYTLKLSHSHDCTATIILDSIVASIGEVSFVPAFERALSKCPRGPPADRIA